LTKERWLHFMTKPPKENFQCTETRYGIVSKRWRQSVLKN
jgi:hypothetical protein